MDLAGIKLLVEAHMMPCLGFLVKTVTAAELLLSSACTEPRTFQLLALPCQQGAAGTVSTADPNWPKAHPIPHGIVLSSKSWGEGREMGDIWSNGICLTKKPLHVKPCFPGGG